MSNKLIWSALLFCVVVAAGAIYAIKFHKENYVSKDRLVCIETRTVTIPERCGLRGCPAPERQYEKCIKYLLTEGDSDKTVQIINGDNNLVIDQIHEELIINNYSDGKNEVIRK